MLQHSPFAGPVVSLEFETGSPLVFHQSFLAKHRRLTLLSRDDHRAVLKKFSVRAGHVFVQYLYTGTYENQTPLPTRRTQLKMAFEVYFLSKRYGLDGLEGLAKNEISALQGRFHVFDVLGIANKANPVKHVPHADDAWFKDLVKAKVKEAFENPDKLLEVTLLMGLEGEIPFSKLVLLGAVEVYQDMVKALKEKEAAIISAQIKESVENSPPAVPALPSHDPSEQPPPNAKPQPVHESVICEESLPIEESSLDPGTVPPPDLECPRPEAEAAEEHATNDTSPRDPPKEQDVEKSEGPPFPADTASNLEAEDQVEIGEPKPQREHEPAEDDDGWGIPSRKKSKKVKKVKRAEPDLAPQPEPEPDPVPEAELTPKPIPDLEAKAVEEEDTWDFPVKESKKFKKLKKEKCEPALDAEPESTPEPEPEHEPELEPEPMPDPEAKAVEDEDPWDVPAKKSKKLKKLKKEKCEPALEAEPESTPAPEPAPVLEAKTDQCAEPEPEPRPLPKSESEAIGIVDEWALPTKKVKKFKKSKGKDGIPVPIATELEPKPAPVDDYRCGSSPELICEPELTPMTPKELDDFFGGSARRMIVQEPEPETCIVEEPGVVLMSELGTEPERNDPFAFWGVKKVRSPRNSL